MAEHDDHERDLLEAEALLRRARPTPPQATVDAMETRLLGRPARSRRGPRLALAGLGFTGGIAAVIVAASLVGVQPWTAGDDRADAEQDCVTSTVTTTTPTGTIVEGPDGEPRVVTVPEPQTREVTRCR